jgi:hypothetical protein
MKKVFFLCLAIMLASASCKKDSETKSTLSSKVSGVYTGFEADFVGMDTMIPAKVTISALSDSLVDINVASSFSNVNYTKVLVRNFSTSDYKFIFNVDSVSCGTIDSIAKLGLLMTFMSSDKLRYFEGSKNK